MNLEKNIFRDFSTTPENQLFSANQERKKKKKKRKKKLLQSYTPCLNSQSVKRRSI